ncbi:MAG: hypothetical protein HY721_18755 [Planctomycetes bacterium]|nr:hypothetical protein [Planctomycetota bacterium]
MPHKTLQILAAMALIPGTAGPARAEHVLPRTNTTDLYVSSYGTNEVHCYRPDGTLKVKLTHPSLSGPRGLAFSPEQELHVASQAKDRILVFRPDGTYLREVSGGGLKEPTSLAFGPGERLHAASFATNEVLVFSGGAFERRFTAEGLRGPNCIAFARSGAIYVASQLTNEVFRFDLDGAFERKLTGGGLASPMGIALYGDELYVTGGASHTVAVFDLDGGFLRNIQGGPSDPVINGPQGIAFDSEGNFAVSSYYTGKVGLYSRDGTPLKVFEESGVRTARSVAFLGDPPEVEFIRGDLNSNGELEIGDPIATLFELFIAVPCDRCLDEADADDDGRVDITDPIYTLTYLFLGGPPPAPPYPERGEDPTPEDGLPCYPGRCRR